MTDATENGGQRPDALERLLAIEDIKCLKSRYLQAVDFKDWPAMEEIFTEDARIDFGGEGQYHVGHHGVTEADLNPVAWIVTGGREAAKVIAGAVGDIIAVHQGHDPQIRILSADHATGRWTLYDRLEYADETMHGYGHYHEEYRRIGGQWRISALTLTRLRVVWEDNRAAS